MASFASRVTGAATPATDSASGDPIETFEVVIIGAGPTGLNTAYALQERGVTGVLLLEQSDTSVSRWRENKWDAFKMNTPHANNRLIGQQDEVDDDVVGVSIIDNIRMWDSHILKHPLPIRYGCEVISVAEASSDIEKATVHEPFLITYIQKKANGDTASITKTLHAKFVVACPGSLQTAKSPPIGEYLDKSIRQFTPDTFKNESQLAPGGVLVVGTGCTGVQLCDVFVDGGHDTYLCVSKNKTMPRKFRGYDLILLGQKLGAFEATKDTFPNPEQTMYLDPALSVGSGSCVSVHSLFRKGVTMLGRVKNVQQNNITCGCANEQGKEQQQEEEQGSFVIELNNDLASNVAYVQATHDAVFNAFCNKTDDNPIFDGCFSGPKVPEPEWVPDQALLDYAPNAPLTLNLKQKGITNIVWCIGFATQLEWLKIESIKKDFGKQGRPINCHTPHKRFFWNAFPFQRTKASVTLVGMARDGQWIVEQICAAQA